MNILNEPNKKILLVDGYHLLHKGYYGSLKRKKVSVNRDNIPINAVFTFVAKIQEMIESDKYHTVIVTFDAEGCWRRKLYPEYKAKRKETPEDLTPQTQIIREYLNMARIPWYEKNEYEGDDIMGTIARIANKCNYDVEILTNDRDTYQLVNDQTVIITNASKNEETIVVSYQEVYEKFSCKPHQVPDMKAMMGDSSDNIKGVVGLHFNVAKILLDKYDNVYEMFEHIDEIDDKKTRDVLLSNKDHILLNRQITEIKRNVDIGRINLKSLRVNWYGVLKFYKKQKMWAFVHRITLKIEQIEKEREAREAERISEEQKIIHD